MDVNEKHIRVSLSLFCELRGVTNNSDIHTYVPPAHDGNDDNVIVQMSYAQNKKMDRVEKDLGVLRREVCAHVVSPSTGYR